MASLWIVQLHHAPATVRSCKRARVPITRAQLYGTTAKPSRAFKAAEDPSQNVSTSFEQPLRRASSILESPVAPDEEQVYSALKICEDLALKLAVPLGAYGPTSSSTKGPTSNLLSIERRAAPPNAPKVALSKAKRARKISTVAYNIAKDPKIFMTQRLLEVYVRTQNVLGRPQSFPHIFDLFASKPIPKPRASPIKFKNPNIKSPSASISLPLAQSALDAAIEVKDLALCLSIIETSVCAPAFRRAKFIRKALLPLTALALSPLAAYKVAWQMCKNSDLFDPQILTNYATVGLIAYLGFTATIGYVALTTANDQMDRITWITGTPLSERWTREEERALIDRVAGAWGLKRPERRGSEEGKEWEELRHWAFDRGMYLDKPDLMEGME